MHSSGQSTHFLRLILLAALSFWSAAQAAIVENLYTAIVERPTEAADPRAAAQAAAMAEVLVRVTGNRAAAFAPELSSLLENPGCCVASFGYTFGGDEAQVVFVPSLIERELTAAGWPVWGAERPLSMLWIAVTDQFGDRAILTAGELPTLERLPDQPPAGEPPAGVSPALEPQGAELPAGDVYSAHMLELLAMLREEIETVAEQRGLPWMLPDFASREDMRLSFEAVWSYSFDSLYDESSVSEADALVIGRVRESVIGTDVEWLVQSDALQASYPGAGVGDGIHWLADAFAEQYGSVGGPRTLTLRVTGVSDFDSYARVLAYLDSMTMLSDVDVESYSAGELVLRAVSRGDASVLARTLNLDSVLREQNRFPGSGAPQGIPAATLDLVVVPEPNVFDPFDSGF